MKTKIFLTKHRPKICAVLFTLAMSVVAVSGGAIAKYIQGSEQLKNDVSLAKYDSPTINDTVSINKDGNFYKSNVDVTVSNDHDYPVYVRVSIIVTWKNQAGNVYCEKPTLGTDYTLTRNTTDWTMHSDSNGYWYYYYNQAVEKGGKTSPLIGADQALTQISQAPVGYTMHVEILTETIQAIGFTTPTTIGDSSTTAVMDAWKWETPSDKATTNITEIPTENTTTSE